MKQWTCPSWMKSLSSWRSTRSNDLANEKKSKKSRSSTLSKLSWKISTAATLTNWISRKDLMKKPKTKQWTRRSWMESLMGFLSERSVVMRKEAWWLCKMMVQTTRVVWHQSNMRSFDIVMKCIVVWHCDEMHCDTNHSRTLANFEINNIEAQWMGPNSLAKQQMTFPNTYATALCVMEDHNLLDGSCQERWLLFTSWLVHHTETSACWFCKGCV